MKETELSHAESLELITSMIHKAKRNIAKRGSFYFLLWGWVVLFGNLGHYLIEKFHWYHAPYVVWLIVIPAVIMSVVYSMRQQQAATSSSQIDKVYGILWIAIFAGIVTVLVFMSKLDFNHNPVILLFAGLGTFVSGRLLRFNPLILGGIALWLCAVVGFNVSVSDQYLVAGVGIVLGYLIPGYLLKKAESKT